MAVVLFVLTWLLNLATKTITIPDRWAPWVGAVTFLFVITAIYFQVRNQPPSNAINGSGLAEEADRLAAAVRAQWRNEEERRWVHYPFPLPVRWHNAREALMDHRANVHRAPAGTTPDPLDLTGQLDQIAKIYQRIPSRRLVILGRAGSGKTILALRLVLDLMDTRTSADRVPVIFSLGSWNPTTTSLRGWLADQLIRDYPALAAPGPAGGSLAAALIDADRILPILDGFDEIAEGLHRAALAGLNATSMPLLLTSRVDEYADAVAGTQVLRSAAGIELADLTLTDLVDYLPRATRKAPFTDTTSATMWDPVLDELREHPHRPASVNLTAVLTTPLMVALARAIYSDTADHDPSVLLDTDRFTTPEAVEDHLLGNFIPAAYRHQPEARPRWDPERVQHWLGYLAQHLDRLGRPDFAWWQLGYTMRRSSRMLLVGIGAGLVIGLVEWLVTGLLIASGYLPEYRPAVWLSSGPLSGLLVGLPAGLAFGLTHGLMAKFAGATIEPSRVRIQILSGASGARERFVSRFRVGLVGGVVFGLVSGFVGGFAVGLVGGLVNGLGDWLMVALWVGLVDALVYGLVFGPGAGLSAGLVALFEAPLDIRSAPSPSELLRMNRKAVIFQLLVFGPMFGLTVALSGWLLTGLLQGLVGPLRYGLAGGLVFGLVGALGGGLGYVLSLTAWGQWVLLARTWLPLTGRLPWAVLAFLDDAYQRDVLRQAGAVYQFRHARLQDHLTHASRARRDL